MNEGHVANGRNFRIAAMIVMAVLVVMAGVDAAAAPRLKALIIDGQMNKAHDWKATSPVLKKIIEDTGLFRVDRATSPARGEPMDSYRPDFGQYDVLIMNYDGDDWPIETQKAFVSYVRSGGGVVVYHSANNAFPHWKEYNEITGLGGWGGRDEKSGPMVRFRDGKIVFDNSPGRGGSHPPQHEFQIVVRNREHPIMAGLPERWMNGKDELYSKLRGPAKNLTVLATAYADPDKKGSGEHEPILFTVKYGKGRVFHTPLGHAPANMQCVGFIYTLQRGTEWAATGKVTQTRVPDDFPTADKASYRRPTTEPQAQWIELLKGKDFSAWREPTGEWQIVGSVFMDPNDEKRLASRPGWGVAVNGIKGKAPDLITKMEHGDIEAHIEFMVPKGSNSGIYFQSRYEIQVFDSWGVEKPKYSDCGGIYQRWRTEPGLEKEQRGYEGHPPRVNASRKPGEWQTFDVIFRAPRFDRSGKKTENAVFVKVVHNGTVIHENQEVTGPTRAPSYVDEVPTGPLKLQGDHGPVAYRNIRVRPLDTGSATALSGPYQEVLGYEFGQSRKPLTAIEEEIRATAPRQHARIEARLIETLESPEATTACKQFVCRMLRRIGTEKSVPALARLLGDKELAHMARFAMQRMPSSKVDRVLRDALAGLRGDLRIGVISSIGDRGDIEAVPQLATLAENKDVATARAAVSALGRIGGERAARALARAKEDRGIETLKADAYLLCADSMLDRGDTSAAARIYREMSRAGNPTMVRVAAYRGIVLAEKDKAVPTILALLRDRDVALQQAAGSFVAEVPSGTAATKTLAAELGTLGPNARIVLLSALTARGDKAAAPQVVAAAESGVPAVRVAALRALGTLGSASDVPLLAKSATADGEIGEAAVESLNRLGGRGVGRALVKAVGRGEPSVRVKVLDALAARGETAGVGAVLKAASDEDSTVRKAAYSALGALAGRNELPNMVAMLTATDSSSERRELERALTSAAGRVRETDAAAAPVIAGLDKAGAAAQTALLAVLGRIGGDDAFDAVRSRLGSGNTEVKKAAIRAMSEWPDAGPASDLLAVARGDSDSACRILAVRGYLRLIGLPSDRPVKKTVEMYEAAAEVAGRPEEKKLVLAGLSTIADLRALALVEKYIEDQSVEAEAKAAQKKIQRLLAK